MQVKLTRFPTVGLYLEYDLYSIPVESGWESEVIYILTLLTKRSMKAE
jgi:hypothetical protein